MRLYEESRRAKDRDKLDRVTGVSTESIPIVNSVEEILKLWLFVAKLEIRILVELFRVHVIG